MKPLVSIIIPVYNSEKYIARCICSVLDQSYDRLQIIVVNDGSKDYSGDIIAGYAETNENILFIDKQNEGVANARNDALKKAEGDYLLFVDADDYLGTGYVKELVECAIREKSELVISGYTLVRSDESMIKEIIPDIYERNVKEEWAYRICSTWGRLYSSSFWKEHKLSFIQEEGARAEDVPITMYANAMAQNICMIPNTEYYYRQHEESAMHKDNGYFRFPYEAFRLAYDSVLEADITNSMEFFLIGTLKLFAQFEFGIYRHADKVERTAFRKYVHELLGRTNGDALRAWRKRLCSIEFPVLYKFVIEAFALKYKGCMK